MDRKVEILIVEDSPTQAIRIQCALQNHGYEAMIAANGREGIALARERKPGLIVSDVAMPGMNGFEMCSIIKADETLRVIPVLLLTSLSDPEDIIRGLNSKADYYITKPYKENYLLEAVDALLAAPPREDDVETEKPLEIIFSGKRLTISSSRQQILQFLLSTYRNTIDQNHKLVEVQRELVKSQLKLKAVNAGLEDTVRQRTAALRAEIAERERTEEALAHERDLLHALMDNIPDLIYFKDTDSRFTRVNRAQAMTLGVSSPEEAVGKTDLDFFAPDHARDALADERRIVATGEPLLGKIERIRMADRGYRWVASTKVAIKDKGGRVTGLVGVSSDVTELREAEQALRLSETRYRSLFEGVPIGVYRTAPDGRILDANPAMVEMFGYPDRESLLTVNAGDFYVNAVDRAEELETLTRSADVRQFEVKMRRRDGQVIWARDTARVVRAADGRLLRIEGTLEDVTGHKRLEEQYLQAQKMESVGRLAGGVAHDFNNLLTAIDGYAGLVKRGLPPESEMQADIDQVIRAGERAAQLTRQLLSFSRRQVIEQKVIGLNPLIQDMDNMLRRLIGEDVELLTVLGRDLSQVKADPGQIEQVLVNLVVNARDAMPNGGKLTVETANVRLGDDYVQQHVGVVAGEYVMLAISDTGSGMSEEVKAHIFEPFFTTKEKGRGTGLGLATVYGIVKQHQGNIWVYSEPGQGTAFKIYLPCVEGSAPKAAPAPAANWVPRGHETVLVVEDEATVRHLAVQTLIDLGYTVLEAANGDEALQAVHDHAGKIDLLLTDVVMPGMNGKELAGRLQIICPNTAVLFASGYTDNTIAHHGVLDEGVAFLQKPFTTVALARKVREVLDDEGNK